MASRDSILREVTRRYFEIGGLLNLIEDDDERELVQERGEQLLNDELHAGSQNRRAMAAMAGMQVSMVDGRAVPGFSVKVPSVSSDPRDGYAPGDPKRIAFDRGPNGGI